ncbi:HNH endonuclease [Sporosarcina sp. Marseille-Q4063]|uniref:HNH endonuclease n=1 Tax=Sporosarcina sp. Marseille-Q4063 TaxID=2810514 RepID=UPI002016845B|nr:HNH endonuclease [Sporosarcina sp. Marseille-Q4063]
MNCSIIIKVRPSHFERKKYCSRKCKGEYQSNHSPINQHLSRKQEVPCSYCKKIILRKRCDINKYANLFCNRECNTLFKKEVVPPGPKRERITLVCQECKTPFEVIKSRKNAKFCNKICLGQANGRRAKVMLSRQVTVNCSRCNEPFNKKPSGLRTLNFCTVNCMGTYYSEKQLFSGENSGTWNGGKITYYGPNWLAQRRAARKRDNFTCQRCGIGEPEYGQELSVHHLIPFAINNDYQVANELINLLSVCEPCHRIIHSGDNHPSKFNNFSVDDIV